MGGKGGSSKPQTSVVKNETSNLPEYARPYFESMMQNAQGMTLGSQYTPYGGQRIADFTPAQQWAMSNQMNAQAPGQFQQGTDLANQAAQGSMNAAQYDPAKFNYQNFAGAQSDWNTQGLPQEQMGGPGSFTSQQAQQFMSPYMQNVVDIEKREAATDAKKAQLAEDLGQSRQGAYGGSRALLASLDRERNLQQQMGDVQTKGLQSAYEAARSQFNTEDAAKQNAELQNMQARINQGQFGAGQGLQQSLANMESRQQAGLANQQLDFEAQKLGEQSRQFGAGQALAGYGQAGGLAQTLANLGQGQFQTEQQLRDKQLSTASMDQALQQQQMDQQYQDFLRQQGYPLEMLQQYSSLLRGVPVTPSSTSTTTTPQASLGQQLMGTGLGALGAYKSLAG